MAERSETADRFLLGEIAACRGENRKMFRCATGAREAVIYDHPVHYLKSGVWAAINNTVKEYKDETGSPRFCNTDSPLFIGSSRKSVE